MPILSRTTVFVTLWLVWLFLLPFGVPSPPTVQATHIPLPLPANQPLRFERLGIPDGLSSSFVTGILQDRQGFIWIGTRDGLNRFDGYSFRTFRYDPVNPGSLTSNIVHVLVEDTAGMLWVGTDQGLDRFDPQTETFTAYQPDPTDPHSLSNQHVFALAPAPDGTLWVGTDAGLNHFDPATEIFTHYTADPADPHSLSDNIVNTLLIDRAGTLWVGTDAGLNRFDPEHAWFTPFFDNTPIHDIVEDAAGMLWVGTVSGLAQFDPGNRRTTWYRHDADTPGSLSRNDVWRVLIDASGVLWVGIVDGGLNHLDADTGRFIAHRYDPERANSITNNAITALYQDREGLLWIGTENGVALLNKYKQQLRHIAAFPGDIVVDLVEDPAGLLWIGTNDGFSVVDPDTRRQVRYYPGENSALAGPTGLHGNFVNMIYHDQAGNVWLATDADLLRFDPAAGTFERYVDRGLSDNVVLAVYQDRAGVLWVGTDAGGLNRYDPERERFRHYRHDPANPNSPAGDRIEIIYEDRAGNLWFGGEGLTQLDPARRQFTTYPLDPNGTAGIIAESVIDIWEDCQGVIWVGTSRGLSRLDPQTSTFAAYTTADGLPNAVINGMLPDAECNLWLSTNQGISRFDPQTGTFRNYDTRDGLHSNDFQYATRTRGADGTLYFGGVHGITAFDPSRIIDNPHAPPVTLTNFLLFNEPVTVGSAAGPLTAAVQYTDEIILSYRDTPIMFEFAALSYAAPTKNQYAYRLEGYDTRWYAVASDRRFATYTALPAGRYTLHVRAANNAGVWNHTGATIRLTVRPPWWEAWWFRGGVIVSMIAAVLGVFGWRTHSIRARNRWLETQVDQRTAELQTALHEVQTAKSEIERLMHARTDAVRTVVHDLKHTVQAVQSALDVWRLKLDSTFNQHSTIQQGHERVAKALCRQYDLLDELRDAALLESDSLVLQLERIDVGQLVQEVVEQMRPRFALATCELTLEENDAPLCAVCDPRRLRRVVHNILENAYRYTTSVRDDGSVQVTLTATDQQITCTIRDNGRGIAPDKLELLGRKFLRLRQGQNDPEGMGLGLNFSIGILRLSGGNLQLTSAGEGQGTTVTVTLPRNLNEA